MHNRPVYSTTTNGFGDLSAAARHRAAVARMARAAARKPCPRHTSYVCDCPSAHLFA